MKKSNVIPLNAVVFNKAKLSKRSFTNRYDRILHKIEQVKAKSDQEIVKIQLELRKLADSGNLTQCLIDQAAQTGISVNLAEILAADTTEKRMAYLRDMP